MPVYQPGIPTGTVNLSEDYLNIQGNFTQLDIVFNVDHVPFSDVTNQKGYHKSIHFNPVSTTAPPNAPNNVPVVRPTSVPGYAQMFSSEINDGYSTTNALFFINGNGNLSQLTANIEPVSLQNGYTFWPGTSRNSSKGAVIYQWGIVAGSSNQNIPVIFNIPFANTCFNVSAIPIRTNATSPGDSFMTVIINGSVTINGFTIGNVGAHSIQGWYWTAIGS